MNVLVRAKIPPRLLIPSSLPRNFLFSLRSVSNVEQSYPYSTRASTSTASSSLKAQEPKKPMTQKPTKSSLSWSQRVKKQAEALAVWPRPTEIPYQAKVANSVNLIGYVKSPVRFESTPDGKHCAVTVISQEDGSLDMSLMIPVVFEGDLAHVVACHVKENDCVYVAGQLSFDPLPMVVSESLGKFHVVVQNLNYVEGLKAKKKGLIAFEEPVKKVPIASDDSDSKAKAEDDESLNQAWKNAIDYAKKSSSLGMKNDGGSSSLNNGAIVEDNVKNVYENESKTEKVYVKSGENNSKKKNGDSDLWRDLVKYPEEWWDYREHKTNGLVKEKYPDFKHKTRGEGLWVNSAPSWVFPGLGKLEFDVKFLGPKQVQDGQGQGPAQGAGQWPAQGAGRGPPQGAGQGPPQGAGRGPPLRKKDGKGDDSWKNVVENPDKWWDNRSNKRNPKQPDFKHKETGEVLWLNTAPEWARSKLPPLKDGQGFDGGKKNVYAGGNI